MRPAIQIKIDDLHAQIAALIEAEKRHHDKTHAGENDLRRQIAHTCIALQRYCPTDRENMRDTTNVLASCKGR